MSKPEKDAGEFRRIEVITGVARRRRWSDEVRAHIVAETFEEGANVSAIARRHGAAPSQVFGWRKEALAQAAAHSATALFTPVVCTNAEAPSPTPEPLTAIEVEIGEARLRIPSNASRETILAVMDGLKALKGRR